MNVRRGDGARRDRSRRDRSRGVRPRAPYGEQRGAAAERRYGAANARLPCGWVSAAHVLVAGFVCFSLWFLFDARQLYQSATSSPLGVRRSVAMSITRPIARFEEFLGFDRLVDGANAALGRNGSTPGSGSAPAGPSVLPPERQSSSSTTIAPSAHGKRPLPPKHVTGTKSGVASLAQPTVRRPITILDVGDSIGEDLGDGLSDAVGTDPKVRLIQAAVGDTGLANEAYYNWPATLESDLHKYHPQLVVVMLGGNDWQSFPVTKAKNAVIDTAFWRQQYSARVRSFITEATSMHAHVVWVGLPIFGPGSPFPTAMPTTLNSVYEQVAKSVPGAAYYSSWSLFTTSSGKYAEFLPNAQGSLVEVRDADGVHLALPGGSDRLADGVVAEIDATFHIKI